MSATVELIARSALRDWLLLKLPAKVTEVNATRAATLRAPRAGPYTIPASSTLGLSVTGSDASFTAFNVTAGSRTTAQMVTEINTAMGGTPASADVDDRLLITSAVTPSTTVPSAVKLRGTTTTDCNTAFGWDKGGEKEVRTALIAPASRGVMDGWPLVLDFGPQSAIGSPICCVVGDSSSAPVRPDVRRDEYVVTLDLTVMRMEGLGLVHRNREPILQSLRCVREVLLQDAGRQLGRASVGDVMLVTEKAAKVAAKPFSFGNPKSPGPLFDVAVMVLEVRVYERPGAT